MNDIWGYPYRLGVTIFLFVGTVFLTAFFVGLAIWLEKSFKNDKLNK